MKPHFFDASFSEKKGLLILVYVLMLLLLIWLLFFQAEEGLSHNDYEQLTSLEKQLAVLKKAEKDTLFYFNPNTITEAELKLLKVNPVAIENWLEKREKYAFNKPGDVLWVRGLSKYDYLKLQKYMVFEEKKKNEFQKKEAYKYASTIEKQKPVKSTSAKPKPFNLNTITQTELEALNVRSYIAERLVKFRESLGGFYSTNQLKDVYGIKEFELKILSSGYIEQNEIATKNWSEESFKELLSHPYVDYELCKRLFNLKDSLKANQFSELDGYLPSTDYNRLDPYFN